MRPLLTNEISAVERARGERTPRSAGFAFFHLSYNHLFGTPLTSIVLVGFYATKPIPRRSISENTFLLNRSGERRATNGSPAHSQSRFNIKTTWTAPVEVAPARGLCCPRPRGMSSNKPVGARRPLLIVRPGALSVEPGVCFSTGLGAGIDTNRSSKAVRRWCELFGSHTALEKPSIIVRLSMPDMRRATKQAEARCFPRSHHLSRGSLLSIRSATRSSNQTTRIFSNSGLFCKKQKQPLGFARPGEQETGEQVARQKESRGYRLEVGGAGDRRYWPRSARLGC